jgi:hypothetical protein
MAVGLEASGFWLRDRLRALSLFLPCLFSTGAEFAVVIDAIRPLLPTECHHQHIASVTQHSDNNEGFHILIIWLESETIN